MRLNVKILLNLERPLSPTSLGCRLAFKFLLFAAEVGVNIKIGRSCAGLLLNLRSRQRKVSPAVLSLKSNSQCQIVVRRPLCRRRSRDVSGVRERHNGHFCYCHVYSRGSHFRNRSIPHRNLCGSDVPCKRGYCCPSWSFANLIYLELIQHLLLVTCTVHYSGKWPFYLYYLSIHVPCSVHQFSNHYLTMLKPNQM